MRTGQFARIAQAGFWAAAAATFAGAVTPPDLGVKLLPWDKAEHFLAFYALMTIALLAFPRRPPLGIALLLSGFGGLIELVQALPFVHRDAEWGDWLADSAAIGAVLLPMALQRWRTSRAR